MSDPTAASAFAAAHHELEGTARTGEPVSGVTSPSVHAPRAADVVTGILAGLYQAQPAIFAATRASPRTQAQVSLGLGLAGILASALASRRT